MRISDWSSDVCSSDLSNRYLTSAVATSSTTLLLLGPTTLAASQRAGESHAEHRAVVAAIAAGDDERAETLMRGQDRKSVGWGQRVSARVVLGGRRTINTHISHSIHRQHRHARE